MYKRTMRLLGEDLEKTGCLHEYYNPFNGEPVMNGGFINWNILALNMADELEGKKPMCLPELLEKQAETGMKYYTTFAKRKMAEK